MFDDAWIIFLCAVFVGLGVLGEILQTKPARVIKRKPKKEPADNPPPPKKEQTPAPVVQPTIPKDELALPLTDERDQGEERARFYQGKEQDKKIQQEKKDMENKEKTLKLREEEMKVFSLQRALNRDKKTFDDRLKLHKERDNLYK